MSLAAAEKLTDLLRADAADRDRANQHPKRELEPLKESGLLALSPEDHVTVHAATRIVSAADPSLGHLLGYHHAHLWRSAMYGNPGLAAWMREETVRRQWFWAGISNPANPLDPALSLSPVDGGFVVNGRRVFCTGAAVADRIVAGGIREDDGASLAFVVAGDTPGITYPPDWDNIGQRLAGGHVFTEAERAALELTEQGTRIADAAGGVTDDAWANAAKHYDEQQLAALVSIIAVINTFNRLNVMVQQPAGDYRPGQFG